MYFPDDTPVAAADYILPNGQPMPYSNVWEENLCFNKITSTNFFFLIFFISNVYTTGNLEQSAEK